MNSTAAPSARRVAITSNSRLTSTAVSAAVGSSITKIRALNEMALAISTICWSATDRPRAARRGSMATPRRANAAAACVYIFARVDAPAAARGCRPRKMFSATVRSGNSVGSW